MTHVAPSPADHRADDAFSIVERQLDRVLREARRRHRPDVLNSLAELAGRLEAELSAEAAAARLACVPLFSVGREPGETALAYFRRVYVPLLQDGPLYTTDLRRHDRRLYEALAVYQASKGRKLSDLLPTPSVDLRASRHP